MTVIVESPSEPPLNPAPAETPTNENDVAIAAIEAEKQVTIAAIDAEARVASDESYNEARVAEAEVVTNRDDERWNSLENQLTSLREQVTMLSATLLTVQSQASSEEVAEEVVEEIAENLTPLSTSAPTSETQTEALPESEEGGAEVIIPPVLEVKPKRIIKLL